MPGTEPGEYDGYQNQADVENLQLKVRALETYCATLETTTFDCLVAIAGVVEELGRRLDHLQGLDLVDDCEPWEEDDDYIDPAMLDASDSRGVL